MLSIDLFYENYHVREAELRKNLLSLVIAISNTESQQRKEKMVLLQHFKMDNIRLMLIKDYASICNNILISIQTEKPKRVLSFRL